MVRHQAVRRAEKALPCCGVKHQLTESALKMSIEPPLMPVTDRKRPMDDGVGLIVLARQSWQVESAVDIRVCAGGSLHLEGNEGTHQRTSSHVPRGSSRGDEA